MKAMETPQSQNIDRRLEAAINDYPEFQRLLDEAKSFDDIDTIIHDFARLSSDDVPVVFEVHTNENMETDARTYTEDELNDGISRVKGFFSSVEYSENLDSHVYDLISHEGIAAAVIKILRNNQSHEKAA
jgi:hypothetical protein